MKEPYLRQLKTGKIRLFNPQNVSNDEVLEPGVDFELLKDWVVCDEAEDFIRLYTRIQGIIFDLSETAIKTFFAISFYNHGKDNKIIIVKSVRQELATISKLKEQSVKNGVTELVGKKLLTRTDASTYLINADLMYSRKDESRKKEIQYQILLKYKA